MSPTTGRGRFSTLKRSDTHDTGEGRAHGGELSVALDDGTHIVADEVVAAGLTPNADNIGLETVGLPPVGGFLDVDNQQCARAADGSWLYAIREVCGRVLLRHTGRYQARVAGDAIAARAAGRADPPSAASGHFGEAGRLHHTGGRQCRCHRAAREAVLDVETVEYGLAALAGTYVMRSDYRGRAKLVVDRGDGGCPGRDGTGALRAASPLPAVRPGSHRAGRCHVRPAGGCPRAAARRVPSGPGSVQRVRSRG
ncbi:hypothetical protein ABT275_35495 [Streptomyces sp. NPDC001185]|uniref:hypothetical protein n=1 Tax=Streptomyces sp. NPDC001185 TaxID=3154380 RepID=UPI0033208F64